MMTKVNNPPQSLQKGSLFEVEPTGWHKQWVTDTVCQQTLANNFSKCWKKIL